MPNNAGAMTRREWDILLDAANRLSSTHVHIVLDESARDRERVVELREVALHVGIPLESETRNPRLPPPSSAHGHLAECRIVAVALCHLTEPVTMTLMRQGRARRDHISVVDEELTNCTGVRALRVQRFDVRLTSRGERPTPLRTAVAPAAR